MQDEDRQFLYDYNKESYSAQIEERDKTRDRITFVIGIIIALASAISILIEHFPPNSPQNLSLTFWISISIGLLFWIIACVITGVIMSRGYKYAYMPNTDSINGCAKQIQLNNQSLAESDRVSISQNIREQLTDALSKCTDNNDKQNTLRACLILWTQRALIISAIFLVFASGANLISSRMDTPEPIKISITNTLKVTPTK